MDWLFWSVVVAASLVVIGLSIGIACLVISGRIARQEERWHEDIW
jgi:hypothetical protein